MNETETQHNPSNSLWFFLLVLLLVCLATGLTVSLLLPDILSGKIASTAKGFLETDNIYFKIRRIGLTQTVAGPVRLGQKGRPDLLVGSIAVNYSPMGLIKKEIHSLEIYGINIGLDLKEGRFHFDSPVIEKLLYEKRADNNSGSTTSSLAIPLQKLVISGGVLSLRNEGELFTIPFNGKLTRKGKDSVEFDIKAAPLDQEVTIRGAFSPSHGTASINAMAGTISMERFSPLLRQFPFFSPSGKARISAMATFKTSPPSLEKASASVSISNPSISMDSLDISGENKTFEAKFVMDSEKSIHLTTSGLGLESPFNIKLKKNDLFFTKEKNSLSLKSRSSISIAPAEIDFRGHHLFVKPLETAFEVKAKVSNGENYSLSLINNPDNETPGKIEVSIDGSEINLPFPQISLELSGSRSDLKADLSIRGKKIRISENRSRILLPSLNLNGKASYLKKEGSPEILCGATIGVPDISLKKGHMNLHIKKMQLKGSAEINGSKVSAATGFAAFTGGRFRDNENDLAVSGVKANIPFSYKSKFKSGGFSVGEITLKGKSLGGLRGKVNQTGSGYRFSGSHLSRLVKGLEFNFKGQALLVGKSSPEVTASFRIPEYRPESPMDLGIFSEEGAGISFDGKISGKGEFRAEASGISANAGFSLDNGSVLISEPEVSITGIDAKVTFPDLPSIRSESSQRISFKTIKSGKIEITDGNVFYQIDSPESILLEKCGFSWCGGHVETQSVRISPEKQDYDVNLYCDRLSLSQLLEQLGGIKADGGGSLNGRIPLSIRGERIDFNDGFLYSTPGSGGNIKLTGTEFLTTGIPEGTMQYAQLDLTREALKDYEYTWAKLGLSSEKDTFLLKLQFDGKPAAPLPFRYKKEVGGFMRVEAGTPGSRFQGIGLDVNIRMPLNKILKYKDITKMLN